MREDDLVDDQISDDLEILRYPEDNDTNGISGIFYGDYFRWDPIEHTANIKKLGNLWMLFRWLYSPDENCDMAFIDIREHEIFKVWIWQSYDQLNIAIRSGRITRAKLWQK